MKLFNNHSGSKGLPRFIKGIYWATGLFLRTPFTEGCAGGNKKASPPGRYREQASKQRCTFRPTTFSSVQFSPYHTSLGIILFLRSLYSKSIPYHVVLLVVQFSCRADSCRRSFGYRIGNIPYQHLTQGCAFRSPFRSPQVTVGHQTGTRLNNFFRPVAGVRKHLTRVDVLVKLLPFANGLHGLSLPIRERDA